MSFTLAWNDKELDVKVREACKKACLDSARDVALDARMNAPVDTGQLVFSIDIKPWEKDDAVGAYVRAGGKDRGYIARFVELGTPGTVYKAGRRKGSPRKPVKAKPYLRPALKKNKGKVLLKFRGKLK